MICIDPSCMKRKMVPTKSKQNAKVQLREVGKSEGPEVRSYLTFYESC